MKVGTGFVDCDGGGYQPFTGEQIFVDGLVEGYNPISLCLRDAAGNTANMQKRSPSTSRHQTDSLFPTIRARPISPVREVELQIVADDDVARLMRSSSLLKGTKAVQRRPH